MSRIDTDSIPSLYHIIVQQPSSLDNGIVVLTFGMEIMKQSDDRNFRLMKISYFKQLSKNIKSEYFTDLLFCNFISSLGEISHQIEILDKVEPSRRVITLRGGIIVCER